MAHTTPVTREEAPLAQERLAFWWTSQGIRKRNQLFHRHRRCRRCELHEPGIQLVVKPEYRLPGPCCWTSREIVATVQSKQE